MKKEYIVADGMSESIWKSLVVKSLRIGWVEGLQAAAQRLPKSTFNNLLVCGLFEDLFPAGWEELEREYQEILAGDLEGLCSHETHHGRGYSDQFCDMADEAVKNSFQGQGIAINVGQQTSLKWVNPRVYNCLYTWFKIFPTDAGVLREPFHHPFTGVPMCIVDGHTLEGKRLGKGQTILSGSYNRHREIGKLVSAKGWADLRQQVAQEKTYIVPKNTLF